MHKEIYQWFNYVRTRHPYFFKGKEVLDVGSLDINGNNRWVFSDCKYTGIDIGPGPNVDVVTVCHEYKCPGSSYDVVISSDCLEHDMHYAKTLRKMADLLRPGGLLLFTCATEGRTEHGTRKREAHASPHTTKLEGWKDWYKNLTEQDIRDSIPIEDIFHEHEFNVIEGSLKDWGKDLRFWGIKKW